MDKIWKRQRENFKYYTDTSVSSELEQKLDTIVEICPRQVAYPVEVKIFKAGPDDKTTKEILSRYRFRNNEKGTIEVAPLTAPLVYFCCQVKTHENQDQLHAGIIGGVMMAETLNAGYDFSFIGCKEEVTQEQEDLINEHLQQVYKIDYDVEAPFLAFCIGIGQIYDESDVIDYLDYHFNDGTNAKFTSNIYKPEKPQRLYKSMG